MADLKIILKDIRAINSAEITLDGITVITGENGSGKSTVSKLTYNLFKINLDYDNI
ncbi:MAG: AAA family ATPase, partial [Bacteroidia bacterium]|nr:AAA family ATPase [Bacteroidia bacterium]